jgi:hypothetical protein
MASIACVATFGGRETVNTYLQGREITAAHDYERPSVEVLHLTRNLTPRRRGSGCDRQASECVTFGLRAIRFRIKRTCRRRDVMSAYGPKADI